MMYMTDELKIKSEAIFEKYKIFLRDVISKEKDLDVVKIEKRFGNKINIEKFALEGTTMYLADGEALEDGYYHTKMRPKFEEGKDVSLYELHSDFVRKYETSGLISKKNGKILLDSFELTPMIYKPDDPEMHKPQRGVIAIIKFEYDK
jgi:hypothetical protein